MVQRGGIDFGGHLVVIRLEFISPEQEFQLMLFLLQAMKAGVKTQTLRWLY